jgi:hypothetical protein
MSAALPPPPRHVRLKPATRRHLFLALLICVGGVALCLYLINQLELTRQLHARRGLEGNFVDGTVTRKYSRRERETRDGAILVGSTYHVEYVFRAEGQTIRGIGRISKPLWDRLRENQPVGVYYTPGNPSLHQLALAGDAARLRTATWLTYGCGAIVALFVLGTIDYLNRIRRQQRLLRDWELSPDGASLRHPKIHSQSEPLDKFNLVEISPPRSRA